MKIELCKQSFSAPKQNLWESAISVCCPHGWPACGKLKAHIVDRIIFTNFAKESESI